MAKAKAPRIWLITSAVAFLCCGFGASLLDIFAERITQYGFAQGLYYILLLIVGLLSAGFLFGALRSYAKYRGKVLSGTLELGGPVVVVILIALIGLIYASPVTKFSLVVRPHGPMGETDLITKGNVTAFFGANPRTEEVGGNGQAQFNEIPSGFLGTKVMVTANVPGFVLRDAGPYEIPSDKVLYIPMDHEQLNSELRGRLLGEDGRPIVGAYVEINQGIASGRTDEHGDFLIHVPAKQGSVVHLWAELAGVPGYDNDVTVPGPLTLTFVPRRKKRDH